MRITLRYDQANLNAKAHDVEFRGRHQRSSSSAHEGLGNVPIQGDLPPPEPLETFRLDDVVCHEALGGLLKHYERNAA